MQGLVTLQCLSKLSTKCHQNIFLVWYLLWNCTHLYSFFMVRLIYFIQTTHYKSLEFAVDGENEPEIEKKLFLFRRLDKTLL